MILAVKSSSSTITPKLNYDVLIENQTDGTVKATLLSLPECQGFGNTKEEALNNLIEVFQTRNPEIVTLEVEHSEVEFPSDENNQGNAWNVLEELVGTIEAPSDWSSQHTFYLYGTPKYSQEIIA